MRRAECSRNSGGDSATAGGRRAGVARWSSPEGIVVSVGSDLTKAISDLSGSKLGGDQAFELVAPDSDKSLTAGYVNFAKVVPLLAENPKDAASLKPLLALGLTGITLGQVLRRVRRMAEDYAARRGAGKDAG